MDIFGVDLGHHYFYFSLSQMLKVELVKYTYSLFMF